MMKKKKKTKAEKKYEDIKRMIESSDKFYKETTLNDMRDVNVLNAFKVLMQPEGFSTSDGARKLYASWPEYCKVNKFMSSETHSQMPDVILSDEMM